MRCNAKPKPLQIKQDTLVKLPVLNCDSWLIVQVIRSVTFCHEINHLILKTQSETVNIHRCLHTHTSYTSCRRYKSSELISHTHSKEVQKYLVTVSSENSCPQSPGMSSKNHPFPPFSVTSQKSIPSAVERKKPSHFSM